MSSVGTASARPAPPAKGRRRLGLIVAAVMALLAGLALGRFVTFDGATPAAAGTGAAAARTSTEQIAELERRVQVDPADIDSWQALGTAAVQRAAETGDPAFYAVAENALDRADAVTPDAPKTLLARGVLALALHDFDRALAVGQRAREALPSNAQALGVVVDAQVELGAYDDAAETLQEMLDVRPDLPALARTSYLRELTGDIDGARGSMAQARSAGAGASYDVASVAALQGDLALADGDVAAAVAAYAEALDLAPGLIAGEVGTARVDAISGDVDAAITRLEGLVARVPHPAAAILLVELQGLAGRTTADDTAELVRSLAALQEDQGQAVDLELALFEADLGEDPARAVALARRAYRARPDNVFTADALGWALHRAGDSDRAQRYADQALRLNTARAALHHHAAEVYAAVGRTADARGALRTAFDLTPWFSFASTDEAKTLARQLDVPTPDAWAGT